MTMRKYAHAILAVLISMAATPAFAVIEDNYSPGEPLVTTPWYGPAGENFRQADLDFIAGMRPHHAGALTMSQEYLASPDAVNSVLQQLARGIIRNQEFEIGMLNTVEGHLGQAPSGRWQRMATRDLAQNQRFVRSPMPGPLDIWAGNKDVSARDVQFAKAMIIHHQAALDMANDYLRQPEARNGYLGRMCLDILVDQSQEIAFMESVIADFPGDPDSVKIDASMIHGMEGMKHHGGHHGNETHNGH